MLLRDLNAQVALDDIAAWIADSAAPLPSGSDSAPRLRHRRRSRPRSVAARRPVSLRTGKLRHVAGLPDSGMSAAPAGPAVSGFKAPVRRNPCHPRDGDCRPSRSSRPAAVDARRATGKSHSGKRRPWPNRRKRRAAAAVRRSPRGRAASMIDASFSGDRRPGLVDFPFLAVSPRPTRESPEGRAAKLEIGAARKRPRNFRFRSRQRAFESLAHRRQASFGKPASPSAIARNADGKSAAETKPFADTELERGRFAPCTLVRVGRRSDVRKNEAKRL